MININKVYIKLFDLRHSEAESVIIFQSIFFILLFVLMMVKPTSAALFISEFGAEELPRAFLLVAVVAAGVTQLISWMNRYPITIVINKTILLCSSIFIIVGLLMYGGLFDAFTPYILYLWVSLFALVSTSQYWLLANIIFNANQAKRVFGIIGSGSIAGAALGGYFSSGISILGGAKVISILVGIILLLCILLTKRLVALNHVEEEAQNSNKVTSGGLLEPFKLIKDSSLLRAISVILLLNVIVSKIVDYHFGVFASRAFIDENELSAFYGFTYSTYNVIGFLIQLFITSKVIKRIGVSSTLIILPVSILISFFGLLILPGMLFAVLLKMSDSSFKQSFQRSSLELLMIPIPQFIKSKVKPFIDVFVDSIATGLAGILLFAITASSYDKGWWTLGLGILFTIPWLILTYRVRKVYFMSTSQEVDDEENSNKILTPRQFKSTLKNLVDEQKFDELKSLFLTRTKYESLGIDQELISLYSSGSTKLKLAIMDFLYFNPEIFIPLSLEEDIRTAESDELKQSIMSYAVISADYKDSEIYPHIDHEDWKIQILTIYALINYYGRVPYLERTLNLKTRLPKLLESSIQSKSQFYIKQCLSIMILFKVEGYNKTLLKYLRGEDKVIKQIVIQLCPLTKDIQFLQALLNLELDPQLNDHRISSLAQFKDTLTDFLGYNQNNLNAHKLVLGCQALGRIRSQESVNMLLGFLVHTNHRVRQNAGENLSRLLHQNPKLVILNDLVYNRIISESEYAIKLHGIRKSVIEGNYFMGTKDGIFIDTLLVQRLATVLEKEFVLVLQLMGTVIPELDFDIIHQHLKKNDKAVQEMAIGHIREYLKPEAFKIVHKLIGIHTQGDSIPTVDISLTKLTKSLLRLKDKEVTKLLGLTELPVR